MALTRKFLAAMGIEADKIDSIIDAHTETVDALKKERDDYKADAEKLPKALEDLKKAQAAAKDSGEYDKLKKEFEDYKADIAGKETLANKKAAFRKVAKDAGLTETGIEKAAKYQNYDEIELDDKGEIKNAKDLMKSIKDEWPEHIATGGTKGADTPKPPVGGAAGEGSKGREGESRAAAYYNQYRASRYGQPAEAKGESK